MKNLFLGLLVGVFTSNLSFGQATLEHSYVTKKWQYEQTNTFKTATGLHFYTLDNLENTLKIYNGGHQLIKNVNINIGGGFIPKYLYAITDKLFNSDDLIEFIIASETEYNATTGSADKLTLFNENGVVLQEFENKSEASIIKDPNGGFKLITISNPFNIIPVVTEIYYDIYALS